MPFPRHLPSLFTLELHAQPSVPGFTSVLASALPYLPQKGSLGALCVTVERGLVLLFTKTNFSLLPGCTAGLHSLAFLEVGLPL